MEEKERYELKIYAGCESYSITDTKEKQQITLENVINLLNKQDKRIKELEEMQKAYKEISYNETLQTFELNNIKSENQQLKQQLHDLPKKIVEDIKEWIKSQIIYCGGKANEVDILIANASNQVLEDLQKILDTILKKYGGE